jgi:hypothetical protein
VLVISQNLISILSGAWVAPPNKTAQDGFTPNIDAILCQDWFFAQVILTQTQKDQLPCKKLK